jgi:hypothetical protein
VRFDHWQTCYLEGVVLDVVAFVLLLEVEGSVLEDCATEDKEKLESAVEP